MMKVKILFIMTIFVIAIGCEKEETYDYNIYKGYWQANYGASTYTISIQSIDPLTIDYSIDEYQWIYTDSYKDFGRLYISYKRETNDGAEYCDAELICLKYNKMAVLLTMISATTPTELSEYTLIFEKL